MHNDSLDVRTRCIAAENPALSSSIDGVVFVGSGRAVVKAVANHSRMDSLDVLGFIVNRLLVKKGADWTAGILSEYVKLYEESLGTFALVWDNNTDRLVSHGCIFQSSRHPWAALLAHIRTADQFKGLGLGTLVTEEVTGAAFRQGAGIVVLATDDKINRLDQGERAAHSMYTRLGYAILGESRLADTIDWLMAIDEQLFVETQRQKAAGGGRLPAQASDRAAQAQQRLVEQTCARFSQANEQGMIEAVRAGDLASLFLLLNICPETNSQLKLSSWQVHFGPEIERTFVTMLRQAIVDQDRLQDASLVLRDEDGAIIAVCAAQLLAPFTRRSYAIDFYCFPALLTSAGDMVGNLVRRTIERINNSPFAPHPCQLLFTGTDSEKVALFQSLGFAASGRSTRYCHADGQSAFNAREYIRILE